MNETAIEPAARAGLAGAMRSEVIKLTGLRSTPWLMGAAVITPFLVTLLWSLSQSETTDAATILSIATPSSFATVILLVLVGIVIGTSDYEANAAIQIYSVLPARTPVVVAKYVAVLVISAIVSLLTTFGTFAFADALSGGGLDAWTSEATRVLLDLSLAETCAALIGVAVGLIVRSSIAALGVVLGFFYLVPFVFAVIPLDAVNLVGKSIPGSSLGSLISIATEPGQLDPITLAVTTLLWTIAWMFAAVITVRRRNF